MTIIIAFALLSEPKGVSAKSEVDPFTPPQAKTKISQKELLKSSSGMYGSTADKNNGSGSTWDYKDANSEAKPIKNNVQKSIEDLYYNQPVQKQYHKSDSDEQCPVNYFTI